MNAQMKFTAAKLAYILNNLEQFTKKQVINETEHIIDELAYNGDFELSTAQEQAFRTLAMAIQKIKCADSLR